MKMTKNERQTTGTEEKERKCLEEVVAALESHGLTLGLKTVQLQRVREGLRVEAEKTESVTDDGGYVYPHLLKREAIHGQEYSVVTVETECQPGNHSYSDSNYLWNMYLVHRGSGTVVEINHDILSDMSRSERWGLAERLEENEGDVTVTLLQGAYSGEWEHPLLPRDAVKDENGRIVGNPTREQRVRHAQERAESEGYALTRKVKKYQFSVEPHLELIDDKETRG